MTHPHSQHETIVPRHAWPVTHAALTAAGITHDARPTTNGRGVRIRTTAAGAELLERLAAQRTT